MNQFQERMHPQKKAPDWIDQNWGERVFNAITCLHLLGAIDDSDVKNIEQKLKKWYERVGDGKY